MEAVIAYNTVSPQTRTFEQLLFVVLLGTTVLWFYYYTPPLAVRGQLKETPPKIRIIPFSKATNETMAPTKENTEEAPVNQQHAMEPTAVDLPDTEKPIARQAKERPQNTATVNTHLLLEEAIELHKIPSKEPESPRHGSIFNHQLRDRLDNQAQKIQSPTHSYQQRFNENSEFVEVNGDLQVKADNGCIFRRKNSGQMEGNWYFAGCEKEHLQLNIEQAQLPSFKRHR